VTRHNTRTRIPLVSRTWTRPVSNIKITVRPDAAYGGFVWIVSDPRTGKGRSELLGCKTFEIAKRDAEQYAMHLESGGEAVANG
jgi:hypothetical protein